MPNLSGDIRTDLYLVNKFEDGLPPAREYWIEMRHRPNGLDAKAEPPIMMKAISVVSEFLVYVN